MIQVSNLSQTFKVPKREPGFKGALKSLFNPQSEEKKALKNVDIAVNAGEIVGLVGANGAGKTTLIKILSGIIYPSSGEVSVLGYKPWERKNIFRRQIGLLMGQKAQLWWDLPARDSFDLLKEIYQVPRAQFISTRDELTETLNVTHLLNTPLRRLSLGERMKMELIAVLLHRPSVVFLDEPTLGLDITSQRAIRKFLLSYAEKYKPAILITSHYMEDIEELCERIVIVRGGEFVYDGSLDEVKTKYSTHVQIRIQLASEIGDNEILSKLQSIDLKSEKIEGHSISIRCLNSQVADSVQKLFQIFPIKDINIDSAEITDIIESLISQKRS